MKEKMSIYIYIMVRRVNPAPDHLENSQQFFATGRGGGG
jgi:hypothetical protein